MYTEINYRDSLYHHGIKGQKWGVRRYQNEDGSYTDAGRARYGIGDLIRDRRIASVQRQTARRLRKSQKFQTNLSSTREKNLHKIENKYQKKIDKAKAQGKDSAVIKSYEAKKDYKIQDFKSGTEIINKAHKYYDSTITNYGDMKISALNDKSIKKTQAYKDAGRRYVTNRMMDLSYGRAYTTLMNANYIGRGLDPYTGKPKK